MAIEYRYLIGRPHHRVFAKYYQRLFPGKEVCVEGIKSYQPENTEVILAEDRPNVVWMFPEIYKGLHGKLRGKQIFIAHGGGFKQWHSQWRVNEINNHIDLYFSSGPPDENKALAAGVSSSIIRKVGYPMLFEIPKLEVRPNALLISSVYWRDWNQYETIVGIIQRLDPSIHGYVTFHPDTPEPKKKMILAACRERENVTVLETIEQLMEAYAYCRWIIASNSSITLPFWFHKKPVILVRGQIGDWKSRLGWIGWRRVIQSTQDELFVRIIRESTKVNRASQFSLRLLQKAKISSSADQVFYPSNYDEQETRIIVTRCMEEII